MAFPFNAPCLDYSCANDEEDGDVKARNGCFIWHQSVGLRVLMDPVYAS